MAKLIQTEDSRFSRDTSSMALINNDKAAYLQYKARRAQGNKVSELSTEVASLKQDMVEIKSMLVTIVEGINGK